MRVIYNNKTSEVTARGRWYVRTKRKTMQRNRTNKFTVVVKTLWT